MATAPIPEPLDSDPSDVAVALEAGRALWDNGDTREALRWFSRAADAAEEAGDDMRALKLARAIAELRDELQLYSMLPPAPAAAAPKAVEPAPAPAPPPAPAPAETRPALEARPAATPSTNDRAPEAEPSDRAALAPSAPASASKPAAPTSKQTGATPSAEAGPAAAEAKPPGIAAKAPPAEVRPAQAPEKAQPAAAAKQPKGDNGRPATARGPAEGALHVAVKTSVRDPNLLLVRILPKGTPAPPGTHEAFLSAADETIDLSRLTD
jgi:hypothetical protein